MLILYLEDCDVKIAELENCVTSSGHTLVACRTISSAITALEENSFDFVLIGIHLQSENAFDLVRFIREHPRLTHLPVILLDSYQTRIAKAVTDSLQVVCRMMDAHYLAMEGFNSKQLIEQIEQLMEEHSAKCKAVL